MGNKWYVPLMVHYKPVGPRSRFKFRFFCTLCSGLFQLSGKAVRLVLLIFPNGEFRQWLKATTKANGNSVARLDLFLPSDKIWAAWQNLGWFWISSVFWVFFLSYIWKPNCRSGWFNPVSNSIVCTTMTTWIWLTLVRQPGQAPQPMYQPFQQTVYTVALKSHWQLTVCLTWKGKSSHTPTCLENNN